MCSIDLHAQEICDNGIDDDGDGLIDLLDQSDCSCSLVFPQPNQMIPNAGFEDTLCCPSGIAQLNCAADWIQASNATSDYFNTCDFMSVISPPNFPLPDSGSGYVGIITSANYNEYIGTCLDSVMEVGVSYTINFHAAWASGNDSIAFTFFGNPDCNNLPWNGSTCPTGIDSWTELGVQTMTFDSLGEWVSVSLTFTPTYAINAIAIGGACNGLDPASGSVNYYYIDDINIDSTKNFPGNISSYNGLYCQEEAILTAATTLTGGTWQWYKEGIALVGETDSILDSELYGLGLYSALYILPEGCTKIDYYLSPPIFPTANFSYTIDQCTGEASFTDQSSIIAGEIEHYTWHFGDYLNSVLEDPDHHYLDTGNYEVFHVVFSADGCPDTTVQIIPYYFDMTADFEFTLNNNTYPANALDTMDLCFGDSLDFTNITSIVLPHTATYMWYYGDGENSNATSTNYNYPSSGTYNAMLIAYADNGCTDTITSPFLVHPYPQADFNLTVNGATYNANPAAFYQFCEGDSIHLTNISSVGQPDSITYFYWTLNDTLTFFNDSTFLINNHLENQVILYTEGPSGCSHSDTLRFRNNDFHQFSFNATKETCFGVKDANMTLNFIGGSHPGTYTFTLIDPNNLIANTQVLNDSSNVAFNNLYFGNWSIQITNETGCVWDTVFNIETISPMINISPSVNAPQCYGTATGSIVVNSTTPGNFSFNILNNSGQVINSPAGTNAANNLIAGVYTIRITDSLGCNHQMDVDLIDPKIILPIFNLTHPLCHGLSTGVAAIDTILDYQGSFDSLIYNWTPNLTGNNGLGETEIHAIPAGEYVLEVIDGVGCTVHQIFHILDPPPLKSSMEIGSPTYCRTASYQNGNGVVAGAGLPDSSGVGNLIYQWKNLVNGDESNFSTFVVRTPGFMQLTIQDDNGCSFVDSIYVDSLNPIAMFSAYSDEFISPTQYEGTELMTVKFENESQNFSQIGNPLSDTIFQWSLDTNEVPDNWFLSLDYDEAIDTVYAGEKIYEVCLIAKNFNHCVDMHCKSIVVHDYPLLIVPNVFTPGAFPNNEFFFPYEGIQDFHCIMMNRYGLPVYEFTHIDDKWNGDHYLNNKPCTEGVYFYLYEAMSTNGTPFEGEGTVHLIRAKK
ncbi:hypothetical protein DNU06_14970 [Putridiphycobacter roseus]|uniref:PKD domain-containing protein n=2 Tax=Putridiphycobacter roseus TaxID=2219161 RepID=A0A2W1MW77_9FLAO|nr:hypothetical protein DNU06_14970 [Putridiphycobacter roseus]